MIVVDTTVLVYAVGSKHPLRAPCRALIELVEDGVIQAVTTTEVVQEFIHVRSRHRPRADAAELARNWATLLSPLVSVDANDLAAGLDLFEQHDVLGAFDAVLLATAQRRGATAIVSADRAFAVAEGIHHLDPASASFLDDLRGGDSPRAGG